MHEIISCISATVLLIIILWTSSLKLCLCDGNNTAAADCDFTESYDEAVTVSVQEPVYVIKYKWCLDIPPRCPDNIQDYRTVYKNITIPKTRTVRRCCKDQIRLYDDCVTKCTEDQCPNVQCVPGTDKCKCKSGFIGYLCRERCAAGYWGAGCKNVCHEACTDCDHRTGCCYTAVVRSRTDIRGLRSCSTKPVTTVSVRAGRDDGGVTADGSAEAARSQTRGPRAQEPRAGQATPRPISDTSGGSRAPPGTRFTEASAEKVMAVEEPGATPDQWPPKTSANADGGGGGFVGTVTTMRVTVYKYDDLMTKLIWISVMTVVAIAMVFVIMFVVFFNCYGVTKLDDRAAQNRRISSIVKNNETCKQNLSHIPSDRYTKNPVLHTPINADLPVHPEIFCPVFSAPHYTGGSALYDSPQPLYEILC